MQSDLSEGDLIPVYLDTVRDLTGEDYAVLSDQERQRAARFLFERHRRLFVIGRVMLRRTLGRAMGLAPDAVPVRVNASGKPMLDCAESGLSFNLSHSGDYAVFSFTRDRRVGVDIELHSSDTDCLSLAREYFSARENRRLTADPSEVQSLFFRYWTLKEAYLKATGTGFSGNWRAIDVSEVEGESPYRDLATFGEIRLQVLDAPSGYSAAIAADGSPWHASVRHWDGDKETVP